MTPRQSATEELHTLGALLRTPFEAQLDYMYAKLARSGYEDVRPAHGAVFRNVSRDGSRITLLAERARMTKQSMAELVEYLCRRGYAELAADPDDGRAKLVRLTAKGWKLHATLVKISRDYEEEAARSLGREKWRRFRDLLEEFADWSREKSGQH
jgi:DNA-binding MarR family transcriptional regulator